MLFPVSDSKKLTVSELIEGGIEPEGHYAVALPRYQNKKSKHKQNLCQIDCLIHLFRFILCWTCFQA